MTDHVLRSGTSLLGTVPDLPLSSGLESIVFRFDKSVNPATWVMQGSSELIQTLRGKLARPGQSRRLVVVAVFPDQVPASGDAEATQEALRGIVQATTREIAHTGSLVNLIMVDASSTAGLSNTFELLASPDGGYVAGFTFDLTKKREGQR